MMSCLVLSVACACALFFCLLFCPVSSVISSDQPTCVSTPSCSPPDLAALRSIAAAFPPHLDLFTSWPASAHNCCGHWGPLTIICSFCFMPNRKHSSATASSVGRVTELAIDHNDLASISFVDINPISLCSLSALTFLRLVGYLISGPIPDCIGNNLTHLVHLNLSRNDLTGSIPLSFSSLPSLQVLDLSQNPLSGAFPAFLSHLAYLDLSSNSFSGSIPSSLNSFTQLSFLELSDNSFSGPIPNPLNLTHLTSLYLTGNAFSGPLPTLNTPKLVYLNLAGNSLTGSIPLSFSRLPYLQGLDLSENMLSGAFPDLILSHQLAYLDLNANSFSGTIPSTLNSLTHLGFIDLRDNLLSGSIPNPLNLTHLTSLDLSGNVFSGPLPTLNTPKLVSLTLFSNYLSGSLSSLFQASNLTSLQSMRISNNQVKGVIPNFHPFHFSSLSQVELDGNLLSGSLPESICGLINLSLLDLSSNAFSGQINTLEMCNFTKFDMLDMSENHFTGPFPDWLGSLSNLTSLSIAHNNLNGSLPNSWKNLTSLYTLKLSGNSVLAPSSNPSAPKLPCWLFALPKLRELYLSSMQLQATDLAEICSSHCAAIGGMALLFSLDLSNNLFNPDILHCFSKITVFHPPMLNLSGNPLKLDLSNPNAVKLLPKLLESLDLSFCMLWGKLTNFFFERLAPSVSFLYLAHNHLGGQIPAELGNMSHLDTLDLSNNFFTGLNSPLSNGGLVGNRYRYLSLSNNRLAGNLLSLLSRIVPNVSSCAAEGGCLGDLDLSHNSLTGAIPPFLFQCLGTNTWRLKLNHNHLNGSLPNVPFPYLGVLSLSNNQLSGQIPSSLRNLTGLQLLDLSHNRLEGNLENSPLFSNASSQQFHQLRVLLLGNNHFTGTIPPSLGDIAPALQLIDFSNNYLTGSIPVSTLQSLPAFKIMYFPTFDVAGTLYEEINANVKGSEETYPYVVQALTALDLSSNKLSGPISTGMGELSGLVYLNLSRNNLSGPIPSDLGRLGGQLESLDLSFNELAGPIPSSFQNLTRLAVFNVSYNKGLSGPILLNNPQFDNNDSYIGDPKLCGFPILPNACPNPDVQHEPHKSMNFVARWIDEWIAIPGLLLGTLVGFLGTLLALKVFKW